MIFTKFKQKKYAIIDFFYNFFSEIVFRQVPVPFLSSISYNIAYFYRIHTIRSSFLLLKYIHLYQFFIHRFPYFFMSLFVQMHVIYDTRLCEF